MLEYEFNECLLASFHVCQFSYHARFILINFFNIFRPDLDYKI